MTARQLIPVTSGATYRTDLPLLLPDELERLRWLEVDHLATIQSTIRMCLDLSQSPVKALTLHARLARISTSRAKLVNDPVGQI